MIETLAKITKPFQDKHEEEMTAQDYQVLKVDLGKGSSEVNMKIFEVSNKKIVDWSLRMLKISKL